MVWYGVVWCGMVWYDVVWCGLVWFSVVWCGAHLTEIALCLNRPPTRAPEILYGAIDTKLRCACDGIGVGWCGMVFCGMVWYIVVCCGVVGCGVVWCGVVWPSCCCTCPGICVPSNNWYHTTPHHNIPHHPTPIPSHAHRNYLSIAPNKISGALVGGRFRHSPISVRWAPH